MGHECEINASLYFAHARMADSVQQGFFGFMRWCKASRSPRDALGQAAELGSGFPDGLAAHDRQSQRSIMDNTERGAADADVRFNYCSPRGLA